MRNKTTEVTEGTERGCLESQNMSTKKLLLFRFNYARLLSPYIGLLPFLIQSQHL